MNHEYTSLPNIIRALLPLVPLSEKKRFVGLLLLTVVMSLSELILAGLVALLAAIFGSTETVLNNNPVRWLREIGLPLSTDPRWLAISVLCCLVLAVIVRNILTFIQQWNTSAFAQTVSAASQLYLFRFYQKAPYLWMTHTGVAELNFGLSASRFLADMLLQLLQIFTNTLLVLALVIGLISISPLLSLIFITTIGVLSCSVIRIFRNLLNRSSNINYEKDQKLFKIIHISLHGLKEIRLSARDNAIYKTFSEMLNESLKSKIHQSVIARIPVYFVEILGFCALLGIMLFLVFIQDAGMARISAVMGFLAAAAWRGLPVINRLVENISNIRVYFPYVNKVVSLINIEQKLNAELRQLPDGPRFPLPFNHEIQIKDISFYYPGTSNSVISNITLTIESGKMVGIIGVSGAGKSTFVNLLTGLLSPTTGSITVDNVVIDKETSDEWLQNIGYVSQMPYILDASLGVNIALSRWGEKIDRVRIQECCKMAALDFLDELEHGIDTILGEGGVRLSGGQVQRVAIARALYSKPSLIIFDEATSALDMQNEKIIHETILSLRNSVTMIIIAHRLTTVEHCDYIIWLEKGKIHRLGPAKIVLAEYRNSLNKNKV